MRDRYTRIWSLLFGGLAVVIAGTLVMTYVRPDMWVLWWLVIILALLCMLALMFDHPDV